MLSDLDLEKGEGHVLPSPKVRFMGHRQVRSLEEYRWPRKEIVKKMVSNGYFRIRWTNCLPDHLQIVHDYGDKMPTLYLFHHASFLEHSRAAHAVFPDKLIQETKSTLALFLPQDDKEVRKWFGEESRKSKNLRDNNAVFRCDHMY